MSYLKTVRKLFNAEKASAPKRKKINVKKSKRIPEVADGIQDAFSNTKKALTKLNDATLNALINKMIDWFDYSEEPEIMADAKKALKGSKTAKIEFILGGDPIFEDGGLMDFLVTNKVIKK